MTTTERARAYLPAAGHHWSLPLYDPLTKLIGVDRVRKRLLAQADLLPSYRVLDVGCGTGSLAVLITRSQPGVQVVGLDPDAKALARGRQKAERAGTSIQFDEGFADDLPYPDAVFDRVFSSFMFHHVAPGQKQGMLREVRRVLKPGGRLELLDFAGPDVGSNGLLARVMHSNHRLKDNAEERILTLMAEAGLVNARQVGRGALLVGRVAYYQASRG